MNYKFSLAVIIALSVGANGVNLGTIKVESSTITDLGVDSKTQSSTVNIIDEKTIEDINPKNINDLLNTIPGITADVRSDVVEIHIRGIGQQEFMWEDTGVAIVIDGVPVMQNGGKVSININDINSIKVIKGSASYLYGDRALAGAIIISTKKHTYKNSASITLEGGSFGYKNIKFKSSKSTENYAFNMHSSYTYEDGYWDKTNNWQKNIGGIFTYYIDDSSDIDFSIDLTKKYQETTRGSVTGVSEAKTNPKGADSDLAWAKDYYTDLYKYYITYNKDFGSIGSLMVNSYYYKDDYSYDSSPQDLNGDREDDTYTKTNSKVIEQYGLKSEFRGQKSKTAYMLGLSIGKRSLKQDTLTTVDYSAYNYRTSEIDNYYNGEDSYTDSKETTIALYSELKYKANNKLSIIGNIRYDYNKYEDENYEKDYNGTSWSDNYDSSDKTFINYSYRLGSTYDINKNNTLYANISTGFRNPTASQYTTNYNLDTEKALNFELGLRGKLNKLISYEASFFRTKTTDIISQKDGTYYWSYPTIYDNVGDATNQGFELSLKSDRSKKFAFSLAYTYINSYYTKHNPFKVALDGGSQTYDIIGNQLPRVPHNKVNLTTYYKATKNLELMTNFYAQSSYYADETNLVKMPGYATVDLKATYKPKKNLEIYAEVKNIFDRQYFQTVYLYRDRNYDGIMDAEDASITVNPGRSFYAGIKYRF